MGSQSFKISRVTSDSREVIPGAAFVAIAGTQSDGQNFLDQAARAGASVLIGEKAYPVSRFSVPYVRVPNSRIELARLAAEFQGHPSHSMRVVGVTGTSGKTTITYLLESIFRAAGKKTGLIGTIECRYWNRVIPSTHTTPGAPELQRMLAEMKKAGVEVVVMEVSSHALKQHRTDFVAFDGAIFTNLTPEHMDYHPDLEDYYQSKRRLFADYAEYSKSVGKKFVTAVHTGNPYGKRMCQELGFDGINIHNLNKIDLTLNGVEVEAPWGKRKTVRNKVRISSTQIQSGLIGGFNLENILVAGELTRRMGISASAIKKGIQKLKKVPGRLERVTPEKYPFQVFVDYAHKPDALEKVLQVLRAFTKRGRILTVFGCGGDRDRTKRPKMGAIAARSSDLVWVTSDNPRKENPNQIIEEILSGVTKKRKIVTVEPDRRKAIRLAVEAAKPGDVLLIAGKGHEDYQIIGVEKQHLDDREEARKALARIEK